VVGVDRDALSLEEARRVAPVVRADFTALPLRGGTLAGAFAWYNTLGTFEPEVAAAILGEVGRCLCRGALFIAHGSHRVRAEAEPHSQYDGHLPDGSRLVEACQFDFAGRRDRLTRRLTLLDGRTMTASFFIRYYDVDEWRALLGAAGLELQWVCGGVDGSALTASSPDLIVGARKRV
jgi:hypothetical protein